MRVGVENLAATMKIPWHQTKLVQIKQLRSWTGTTMVILGLLGCGTLTACGGWQLVWSDEFDGAVIDTNHWRFETGNHRGWGNRELEYYTGRSENAYVSNGFLHIVARKESTNGFSYTSARMKTEGFYAGKYGRFEFRAQLPAGQGFWPAIWLMPESSHYGRWPNSGEIDVVENRGSHPGQEGGTIHFSGAQGNHVYRGKTYYFPDGGSVTNFHTYDLVWTTNSIQWLVDGKLYETQSHWSTARAPYPAPFDQPFYIILNLAVGGNYGGDPDTNTVFPGEMVVDYIRVYDNVATDSVR
jgi:beta-glucanase (GH16 family)